MIDCNVRIGDRELLFGGEWLVPHGDSVWLKYVDPEGDSHSLELRFEDLPAAEEEEKSKRRTGPHIFIDSSSKGVLIKFIGFSSGLGSAMNDPVHYATGKDFRLAFLAEVAKRATTWKVFFQILKVPL